MNLLIIGCGQTGAELAGILSREGHDVSIVAESPDAFSLLSEDFSGYRTAGSLIDQDVLRKAGAENCSALAAVSDDDNVNIMVCQIAREEFGVTELIACVNDPRREDVYSRLGLRTICPTRITVDSLKASFSPKIINSCTSAPVPWASGTSPSPGGWWAFPPMHWIPEGIGYFSPCAGATAAFICWQKAR